MGKQVLKAIRDGYGEGLVIVGENKNVVVLTADLTTSTKCDSFLKKYPTRLIQCGICEQNMMSAAAGFAVVGKIPFVNSFAAFNPGRNWDQLRVSICYSNLNVKIHGSHAGLSVGADGATHQALEDIAITRVLPNLVVLVPADATEAKNAVIAASKYNGPVYIRTSRESVPEITKDKEFIIGKANVLEEGCDVSIIACGILVNEALDAYSELKKIGINAEIINLSTIKPLDKKTILKSVKKTGCIVSCEEHQKIGGVGSAIAELLVQNELYPQEFVAVDDTFGESGNTRELLSKYNIDSKAIIKAAKKVIKRKN